MYQVKIKLDKKKIKILTFGVMETTEIVSY